MKTEGNAPIGVIDGMYGADAMAGGHTGLTKREHFATMAMQGWISATELSKVSMSEVDNLPKNAAYFAVKYADELIEELNKVVDNG